MGVIVADIIELGKKLKGCCKKRSDNGTFVVFEVRNTALDQEERVEKNKMWREDDLLWWQEDKVLEQKYV